VGSINVAEERRVKRGREWRCSWQGGGGVEVEVGIEEYRRRGVW